MSLLGLILIILVVLLILGGGTASSNENTATVVSVWAVSLLSFCSSYSLQEDYNRKEKS